MVNRYYLECTFKMLMKHVGNIIYYTKRSTMSGGCTFQFRWRSNSQCIEAADKTT